MDIEHSGYRENIPAYAIGALDADEAAALELHLRTCDACRSELASYRGVSEGLLAAQPAQEPPAALRSRLRERLPAAPAGRRAKRSRMTWSLGQFAIGLTVLLLLGLNLLSFLQMRGLQQGQADLMKQVQTDQAALSMLAYQGTDSIPIEAGQVTGTLLINKAENMAMLITWNLPALPAGQTYQAWLVQPDGIRVSAAIFRPEQGQVYTAGMISAPQSLNTFSSLGVTIEPAGGSTQPTGERILKVDF